MPSATRVGELDVLIIDDDQDLARMVITVLEHHAGQGFSIRHVSTAADGLEAYDRRPADVVVLDLSLPDAERAEPLGVLRELLSRHPTPCVVVLTAHPWGLGREALRMGAEDYVDKQRMSASTLRNSIVYAVERHAHRARAAAASTKTTQHAPTQDATRGAERLRGPLSLLTRSLEQAHAAHNAVTGGDPEVDQLMDQALRAAYAMSGQLDQVVAAYRRVEDREPVDLGLLAEGVAADLDGLAASIGGRIDVGRLPSVWGQREPLRLLLRNLMVNALQHTRPGVTVRVSASDHPRGVRLFVDDDGPGIPLEQRSDVFELLGTAPGGPGFGLRACSAVATAHGGRVWVEDSPYGGARVVVELPVRRRVP